MSERPPGPRTDERTKTTNKHEDHTQQEEIDFALEILDLIDARLRDAEYGDAVEYLKPRKLSPLDPRFRPDHQWEPTTDEERLLADILTSIHRFHAEASELLRGHLGMAEDDWDNAEHEHYVKLQTERGDRKKR